MIIKNPATIISLCPSGINDHKTTKQSSSHCPYSPYPLISYGEPILNQIVVFYGLGSPTEKKKETSLILSVNLPVGHQ